MQEQYNQYIDTKKNVDTRCSSGGINRKIIEKRLKKVLTLSCTGAIIIFADAAMTQKTAKAKIA